jgi:hypothetical protein
LFNDRGVTGVKQWSGHDNHLHVSFLPSSAPTTSSKTAPTAGYGSYLPAPAPSAKTYFKDSPRLKSVPLAPTIPIAVDRQPRSRRTLANIYNRLGGLMRSVAIEARIEVQAALGVWYVKS